MRKVFFLTIFVLTFLSSCITKERCEQRFPSVKSDSIVIKDSVVIRQVAVTIPKDSIVWHDSIPCKDVYFNFSETKNNITASVNISKGKIKFKCEADSLRAVIAAKDSYISTIKNKVEIKEVYKLYTKWYYTPCVWFTLLWIFCGLVITLFLFVKSKI